MPKLLVFFPADRVIIDGDEGTIGVVGILSGVRVGFPSGHNLRSGAAAPLRWYVLTIWKKESADADQQYRQRIRLITPSGIVAVELYLDFRFATPLHRNKMTIDGFPIPEYGEFVLRLSLQRNDEDWVDQSDYPLLIEPTPQLAST